MHISNKCSIAVHCLIFIYEYGEEKKVKAGDTVIIPVEHWHAIKALTELTFIEVQSGNPLIEEDIERTEWNWESTSYQ